MTTWPSRPRTPSTQRRWTLTRECAVLLFVSQVLVVMIHTLHRMAQGVAHVISSMHEVCGSPSTLSPPFSSTSSSSHSSSFSCTSSCTSSTTLRAVASLCTPPESLWTLLTTPTSSQVMSPTPTTSRRLMSSHWKHRPLSTQRPCTAYSFLPRALHLKGEDCRKLKRQQQSSNVPWPRSEKDGLGMVWKNKVPMETTARECGWSEFSRYVGHLSVKGRESGEKFPQKWIQWDHSERTDSYVEQKL